jgi:hypothetical protein
LLLLLLLCVACRLSLVFVIGCWLLVVVVDRLVAERDFTVTSPKSVYTGEGMPLDRVQRVTNKRVTTNLVDREIAPVVTRSTLIA